MAYKGEAQERVRGRADAPEGLPAALREAREARGLSRPALAAELEVSEQSVYLWETGRARPSIERVAALARTLELEAARLLELMAA